MRRYGRELQVDGPIGPEEYARPYAWWGWHWTPPVPLSIVEMIDAGTLDRRAAALLWLLLGSRRSVLLASEPPMSGKTTLLSALISFLPPDTQLVFLRGLSETFDYTRLADSRRAYLLVNELSSHLPVYLWGRKAQAMFRTLRDGYGVGATMHADDVDGVLAQLRGELGVGTDELACLDVVGIMRTLRGDVPILGHDDVPPEMRYGADAIRRRLVALHLLVRDGERLDAPLLCAWDPGEDAHRWTLEPLVGELARRTGRSALNFRGALAEREAYLASIAARGLRRPSDVHAAIAAYRGA